MKEYRNMTPGESRKFTTGFFAMILLGAAIAAGLIFVTLKPFFE